jgi:phenylacetic acid degradation operon negative regulatory protein
MKKEELKKAILKISKGIVSTMTDLILVQIFFWLELGLRGGHGPGDVHWAMEEAFSRLEEKQVKQTTYRLKKRGLIKYPKGKGILTSKITVAGKKRLARLLPVYDEKRTWDKKIYLVTYDIPEDKRTDRNRLRDYLKKIGCGMLQASVWLTLYNPKEVLQEFIEERKLAGQVLISDLGKDGSIGEESLKELIARVYQLDKINNRYLNFVQDWQAKEGLKDFEKSQLNFSFFSILKDDAQLPFELLPEGWVGDRAYQIFKALA